MFWDTGYSNSANIDALLNKENCTLRELLEEEDILQECKSQNIKLVKFLSRAEIVDELVSYILTEPSADISEEKRFLYPNVASEILTSDVPSLKQIIVEDTAIMNKLYGFFESKEPLNPLLASYVTRTIGTLITKKIEQDWFLYQTICLHVFEFFKTKDDFLATIVQHFATPVVVDLLLNMLNDIEDPKMKSNFLEWINEKGLVPTMLNVLMKPDEVDKHESIAQFLIELIKVGRCARQNDTDERKAPPNQLLQRLENQSTVDQLLDVILSETCTESGMLPAIQVLLCLLENPIIQEPVSQTALQQIVDAEKEHHDEIVASLMEVIYPRIAMIYELLLNPPVKQLAHGTSGYPLTPPLGNVRLQLCYLFTVLLETENTSVIEEICKTNFFNELLKLFKQYCWNNFLHNYVKRCFVYGIQAFDTIPDSTQLVISALQIHIVVDCKLVEMLLDCWDENTKSTSVPGGRRMGYMGHLIEILNAVQSTIQASEEFCALLEKDLDEITVEKWRSLLKENEEELGKQSRLLADCDPSQQQQEFEVVGMNGYPSTNEYENDTEEFDYLYNSSSLHGAVNGIDFSEEFIGDEDIESRNKMFEEACNQNLTTFSMDNNFANWENANSSNLDFPFDFNASLSVKPSSPFQTSGSDDPFTDATNSGFNQIIGNDSHHNGSVNIFGQSDYLTNYYHVSPITATNFSLDSTTHNTTRTNNQLSSSSSYNPFLLMMQNENNNDDNTVNCNNDNWAAFDTDNFADFDSHFAEFNSSSSPFAVAASKDEDDEADHDDNGTIKTQTFVATTQTIEISTAPPELIASQPAPQPTTLISALNANFMLGGPIAQMTSAMDTLELDEDEFFSLRDDSNDVCSLTDDKTKNAENTEVPDDDDDDFASADESSSKGNSEEEIIGDSPPHDAKNVMHTLNGADSDDASPPEPKDDVSDASNAQSTVKSASEKLAQASDSEITSPVVPLENGSA